MTMLLRGQGASSDLKKEPRQCRALNGKPPWLHVQVLLQPCHSCHSALPSHSSSHGDSTTSHAACSILIEFCEKFSDTKLKSAS